MHILCFAMTVVPSGGHDSGSTTSRLREPGGATVDGPESIGCGDTTVVVLTGLRVLHERTVVRAHDHVSDCSVEG